MTQAIFYKHLKYWVDPDKKKEPFCFARFEDRHVVATNGHCMLVTTNWQVTEPHYEDVNGQVVDCEAQFPDYKRHVIDLDDAAWSYTEVAPFGGRYGMIPRWRAFLDYVRKGCKIPGCSYPPTIILQRRRNYLLAYYCNELTRSMTVLKDDLRHGTMEEMHDWQGAYNAEYLFHAFDLLRDTKPGMVSIGVNRQELPQFFIHTKDLYIVISGVRFKWDEDEGFYGPARRIWRAANDLPDLKETSDMLGA